jgi:hypothetical protein
VTVTEDQQIGALREEVRRAGKRSGSLRRALSLGLSLAALGLTAGGIVQAIHADNEFTFLLVQAAVISGVGALACGLLTAASAAALYRRARESRLSAQLARSAPVERADLLRSLQVDASSDVRKIAARLMRDLPLGAEAPRYGVAALDEGAAAQVADLRRQLRAAGRSTHKARAGVGLTIALAMLGWVAWWLGRSAGLHASEMALLAVTTVVFCISIGSAAGFALARLYRWARRTRLRRRLADLPKNARVALLLPLADEAAGDTGEIVASLVREFGVHRELSPAVPDARGDEASPAENEP